MSRQFQRYIEQSQSPPNQDPMFMRMSMFCGPLVLCALSGCAAENTWQSNAAPTPATALPQQTAAAPQTSPPVANEVSNVLASIAIERVTGDQSRLQSVATISEMH
jgi:hypothetical protein